jgi:lipopolysaccharide export system protein LptA
MKHLSGAACAWILSLAFAGVAAAAETPAASEVTVITSEKLTFDYKNHVAVFENDVVVTDPEMQLKSIKLTVQFAEGGGAEVIKAEGDVKITQVDKSAVAQVATYDVGTGKIVLTGNPRVTRGKDTLQGEVITYWRDENKMTCQSRARLVIYPEKGGAKDSVLGD